jgi:V/A-type H+-transporting ATPase subunit K
MDLTQGLIALGAGIAIGFAALGSGIGQGMAASAAAGATTEKEEMFSKGLIFAALPETQAIYGFVIAAILLFVFSAT